MKNLAKIALTAISISLAAPSFAAATTTDASSISPAERKKIETVVHEYLINNPQVMIEVMQVLQRKQAEETQQTVKQTQKIASSFANALFHQNNDPVAGNPNGKVTVVEFFDYQCPHCIDMVPVMAEVIKANPNVRVIYKEFPIRGPVSEFAARAALAANKQGKYETLSHALLTSTTPLTQDSILQTAKAVGLDVEKLQKDMNDGSIQKQLKDNIKLAQDLKLFGTPALFIGETTSTAASKNQIDYIPGHAPKEQIQVIIDKVK
jgi:protein-disulfide isomerase